MRRSAVLKGGLVVLALSAAPMSAQAQFRQGRYDVRHDFNLTPGGNVLPLVTGYSFQHAWLREPVFTDAKFAPLGQAPAFDPYGTELYSYTGGLNLPSGGGPAVPLILANFNITSAGTNAGSCTTVTGASCNASACTDFFVAPFALGTPVSGSIRSAGGCNVAASTRGFFEAYAYSTAFIKVESGQQLATGQIIWTPFVDSVAGSTHVSILRDPIRAVVADANGNVATAVLLDIDMVTFDPGGAVNWNANTLTVDSAEFNLSIVMDSALVTNPGTLQVRVKNGAVHTSFGNGRFAGVNPAPGTAIPFSIPLQNAMQLTYNLNPLMPGITNAQLDFSGAGSSPADVRYCNPDINADDFSDAIDYDLFIGAWLLNDVAVADYNGDEFVDAIDYDLFIGDWLNGCP